jgi:hypothetical protein
MYVQAASTKTITNGLISLENAIKWEVMQESWAETRPVWLASLAGQDLTVSALAAQLLSLRTSMKSECTLATFDNSHWTKDVRSLLEDDPGTASITIVSRLWRGV